jgi:transposase
LAIVRVSRGESVPKLESFTLGALPVVNPFLRRLKLEGILSPYLPPGDRRQKLAPSRALMVLLRNLLVSREPLYGVGAWASPFEPSLMGLTRDEVALLNDDRIGRALEDLFDADRPSLVLRVVVQAVREFGLRLDRFHNDSTTISFQGLYRVADGRKRRGKPTPKITFGHSKDRRPDLKQLLWNLTVTEDGAVPVDYRVLDGNVTDDQIHRQTWDVLAVLAGGPNFLYVADSKLCTKPNMLHIDSHKGRFLTVLPATRKEDTRMRDWMQLHEVPWKEVLRRPHPSKRRHPPDVFRAYSDPAGSAEGFRIVWFHSTEKERRDREEREDRIDRAVRALQELRDRLASPRSRLRRRDRVDDAIEHALGLSGAKRWLEVAVTRHAVEKYRQSKPGRPGRDTTYRRKIRVRFDIAWTPNEVNRRYDLKTDGIFPLITNDRKLSTKKVLRAYKLGQPRLEVRHHHLKAFHKVAPQYLKSVTRIEAFLCVYFLALLVNALIEREIRAGMKRHRVRALELYYENRPCKHPTTEQVLKAFDGLMVHRLHERRPGSRHHVYPPQLSRLQRRLLRLLGLAPDAYRIA